MISLGREKSKPVSDKLLAVKGEFGEVSPYACFSLFPRPPILTTVNRKTQNQMDLWTILMFPSYTQGQHEQSDM